MDRWEVMSHFPMPRCWRRISLDCVIRLTPEEIERYRWLGEKASLALEKTVMKAKKGEKESEVVGRLCKELWKDRIDPITLMSAADDRVSKFRHSIPTERKIEKYLMVSVNARKWGLIVSLTRFVYFGRLPKELRAKYEANVFIDCTFMAHTRPGVPVQRKSFKKESMPIRKKDIRRSGDSITREDPSVIRAEITEPISKRPISSRRIRPSPGTRPSLEQNQRIPSLPPQRARR